GGAGGGRVGGPSYETDCSHVRAVHYNVCLNGILPDDVRASDFVVIGSERPQVLPRLVDGEGCCAVMRALPVGRGDDEGGRPWYTVYFTTYFQDGVWDEREVIGNKKGSEYLWPYEKLDYELGKWIEGGKLYWLGGGEERPLMNDLASFPYQVDEGLVGRWAIWKGELHLLPNRLRVTKNFRSPHFGQVKSRKARGLRERPLRHVDEVEYEEFYRRCFGWL
ncbi:MAG TPA: hypothetical protein VLL52_15030, partial [Anaerolineae bacterium]|nr:hypothetical protein [Anaerolineae bacterium]